jgi:hypothetical protein
MFIIKAKIFEEEAIEDLDRYPRKTVFEKISEKRNKFSIASIFS